MHYTAICPKCEKFYFVGFDRPREYFCPHPLKSIVGLLDEPILPDMPLEIDKVKCQIVQREN